jgi:hypothetical protein
MDMATGIFNHSLNQIAENTEMTPHLEAHLERIKEN